MPNPDVILDALKQFERLTRAHRYGGMLDKHDLATAALAAYTSGQRCGIPTQLQFVTIADPTERVAR